MKIIYRIIAVLLLLQCIFSPVFASETRITQLFITNGGWEYRHTFLYDDFGYVRLETKYVHSLTHGWLRRSQTEWNRSTNAVTQHERVFENNAWRDVYSIETQYNAQGLKIEESFFHYVSGVRTLIKRVQYLYSGIRLVETREFRNAVPVLMNLFWQDDTVLTQWTIGTDEAFVSRTAYDAQGKPQAMLVQRQVGNVLHNTDSVTWFYNDNGQLFSQRSRRWNERSGYWENSQKVNFEYNAAGYLIAETYLRWSGVHWENMFRHEFHRNENNVQIRRTLQGHIHRTWRDMISIHYSDIQNDRARKMVSKFDFWGGNTGELTASHIPFYFNDELVIRRAERIRISYDPVVTPTEDGVTIEWVHIEGAAYYILAIYADSARTQPPVDYAKVNAQGNIVHTSQNIRSGTSFLSHTFTGLDSGTQFFFSITAIDYRDEELDVSDGDFTTLVPVSVGIPEISQPDELVIRVYPNPSDGIFYLSSASHEILSWRVFSLTGQPVKSNVQRTHSSVIDLTNLPTGVYILQVQTTIGMQQKRLIKR